MALSVETVELDVTNNASVDTAFKVVSAKTGSNRLIGKPLQEVNPFLVFGIDRQSQRSLRLHAKRCSVVLALGYKVV